MLPINMYNSSYLPRQRHASTTMQAIRQLHSSAPFQSKPVPHPTPESTKPPLSALNSAIVNNITTPNGARPNRGGQQQLPPNYKPVARKVTLAIVALPVLLVTSWVLWDRLVMGKEKKELIRPFVKDEEQPANSDFLRGRK